VLALDRVQPVKISTPVIDLHQGVIDRSAVRNSGTVARRRGQQNHVSIGDEVEGEEGIAEDQRVTPRRRKWIDLIVIDTDDHCDSTHPSPPIESTGSVNSQSLNLRELSIDTLARSKGPDAPRLDPSYPPA
jgi:hypothetical protein